MSLIALIDCIKKFVNDGVCRRRRCRFSRVLFRLMMVVMRGGKEMVLGRCFVVVPVGARQWCWRPDNRRTYFLIGAALQTMLLSFGAL